MRFVKYLVSFLVATGWVATKANAQNIEQETAFDRELRQRDDQPVREFVESKENIDIKEKAQNLEISGDVRFEWRRIEEKGIVLIVDPYDCSSFHESDYSSFHQQYRSFRGGHRVDNEGIPLSHHDFDVEFNIKFKYDFDRAWAMAHLQFDNPAGIRARRECFGEYPVFNRRGDEVERQLERDIRFALKGSGEANLITLKRAYIGYNVWADGKKRFDIEVGRRKLDDIFDSEIQFTSRFDGILFKYASELKNFSDWYGDFGVFLIDERVNHFGYIMEVGLINIKDWGLDLRYSFIDWKKRGTNRCFIRNPLGTQFQNSQFTITYTFFPLSDKLPFEFYSGFLINHAAKRKVFTHRLKKNLGWYAGLYIGNVDKKGDWAIDIEYIGVQAQAVPEFDVGSIGRGNILNTLLTDIVNERFVQSGVSINPEELSDIPSSGIIGYFPRGGNTNFIGWRFEFLYAITDNLSLDFIYEFSNEEDRHIGGRHYYADAEIEVIYAF